MLENYIHPKPGDVFPLSNCEKVVVVTEPATPPPTVWEPTHTITSYDSTVTTTLGLHCDGCSDIETVTLIVDYLDPTGNASDVIFVTETQTATETEFTCLPSKNLTARATHPTESRVREMQVTLSTEDDSRGKIHPTESRIRELYVTLDPEDNDRGQIHPTESRVREMHVPLATKSYNREWDSKDHPQDYVRHSLRAPVSGQPDCTVHVPLLPSIVNSGGTKTIFTTTSTYTSSLPCPNGCTTAAFRNLPLGVLPPLAMGYDFTTTVTQPSVEVEYACATSSPAPSSMVTVTKRQDNRPEELRPSRITPQLQAATPCVSYTVLPPVLPPPTLTVYPQTETSTSEIDCHGCVVEWVTGQVYLFAPHTYVATVTEATPTTRTVLACDS